MLNDLYEGATGAPDVAFVLTSATVRGRVALLTLVLTLACACTARADSSSLYHGPGPRPGPDILYEPPATASR